MFYFRYGIFVLSIYFFLNINPKLENSFFFGLLFSLLFVLINSDFQIYFGRDLFGNIYDGTRLSSIFGDELILGDYFINFLPILISLFVAYFNKNLFYNVLFLLILINSVFLIFYSGERIAVFYAVIYLIFLCIFFPIKKKLLNIILFTLIIISIIFIYLNQNIKERLVNQTIRDLKITLNGENTKETNLFIFSQQHQYYYETALNIFNGSNKLIGSGPKTYRELCKEEKFKSFYDNNIVCSTSPHNYYIQALSETGIIGIIILASVFIYFLMQLFRFKTSDNILNFKYKSVIFVILTNIFPFMPSGSLFNNYYSLILYFNFSLFIYYKSKL